MEMPREATVCHGVYDYVGNEERRFNTSVQIMCYSDYIAFASQVINAEASNGLSVERKDIC